MSASVQLPSLPADSVRLVHLSVSEASERRVVALMASIPRLLVACQFRPPMGRKCTFGEASVLETVLLREGRTSFNLQFLRATTDSGKSIEVSTTSQDHGDQNDHDGMVPNNANQLRETSKLDEVMQSLKRYGVSGLLSYGLLNTVYYLVTFLFVWLYVAPAPGRLGYGAASGRFFKVMAMVWAGSQVTKLARAGGALALAPFVDKGLSWFTHKYKFKSREKAFMVVAGACFFLAFLLFMVVTALWA